MSAPTSAPKSFDVTVSGCLFDLDGTLMLSTDSVEAFWHDFAEKHNIDANEVLKESHGVRTIEMFKKYKPEFANEEDTGNLEATIAKRWKHLAKPVPGVHDLLESLPADRWGVVTSGTYKLAIQWIEDFLQIKKPPVFIAAEDIARGKPDPLGYLTGKERLGLGNKFLVFEDAPAGIRAGKAAGATVIGMATTYDAKFVKDNGADIVIADLTHIKVKSWDAEKKELVLSITDAIYA